MIRQIAAIGVASDCWPYCDLVLVPEVWVGPELLENITFGNVDAWHIVGFNVVSKCSSCDLLCIMKQCHGCGFGIIDLFDLLEKVIGYVYASLISSPTACFEAISELVTIEN